MTDAYVVPGPACNLCGVAEAIGSMQNLSDYSTVRFCGECGPVYLRAMADAIEGVEPGAQAEPVDPLAADTLEGRVAAETETCPVCSAAVELADIPAHVEMHAAESADDQGEGEPGSARDHWASTTHVRRSTHGHRTTKRPAPGPKGDDAP